MVLCVIWEHCSQRTSGRYELWVTTVAARGSEGVVTVVKVGLPTLANPGHLYYNPLL